MNVNGYANSHSDNSVPQSRGRGWRGQGGQGRGRRGHPLENAQRGSLRGRGGRGQDRGGLSNRGRGKGQRGRGYDERRNVQNYERSYSNRNYYQQSGNNIPLRNMEPEKASDLYGPIIQKTLPKHRKGEIPDDLYKTIEAVMESFGGVMLLTKLIPECEIRLNRTIRMAALGFCITSDLIEKMPNYDLTVVDRKRVVFDNRITNGPQVIANAAELTKAITPIVVVPPSIADLTILASDSESEEEEEEETELELSPYENFQIHSRFRHLFRPIDFSEFKPVHLSVDVCKRVTYLLTVGFPHGILGEKLVRLYQVFFQSLDLSYKQYDLICTQDLTEAESTVMKAHTIDGKHYVVSTFFKDQYFNVISQPLPRVENDLPWSVVKPHERYGVKFWDEVAKKGVPFEARVWEHTSPSLMYLIVQSKEHSCVTEEIMNAMTYFYQNDALWSSYYEIKAEELEIFQPVALFFKEDNWMYRAVFTSKVHETSTRVLYKFYLIDSGIEVEYTDPYVYHLHRIFFNLPGQALKASLYGIQSPTGEWSKEAIKESFRHVQSAVVECVMHNSVRDHAEIIIYSVPQIFQSDSPNDLSRLDKSVQSPQNVVHINAKLVEDEHAIYKPTINYKQELLQLKQIHEQHKRSLRENTRTVNPRQYIPTASDFVY